MASSHQSEGDELYWKIPLGKLSSTVISDIAEAKEEIHQLLLSDSRDNNVVLGDLFNLYVSTNCSAASEILLDQSQQHHVNVSSIHPTNVPSKTTLSKFAFLGIGKTVCRLESFMRICNFSSKK